MRRLVDESQPTVIKGKVHSDWRDSVGRESNVEQSAVLPLNQLLTAGKTSMDTTSPWRTLFENWPGAIPRTGIAITKFQESVEFVDFLVSGGIVLLERPTPDSSNARKVMLEYEAISAVKITSTVELARFQVMGFQPPM